MKPLFTPDNHPLILAPMADLTHAGFRLLIDHYGGCDLFYSEMIDARLYRQGGPLEKYYDSVEPGSDKVIFQLIGADREDMTASALKLARLNPAGIDINMGCSAPHIIKVKAGCALMRDRTKAAELVKSLRDALPPEIAVSAKLRLGEREDGEALISFASSLEQAGADFLVLHPKTRKEKAARIPRKEYIGLLQRELNIPVVANGHINSPAEYKLCREKQQPGGTMIGRQATRQPWFFALLKDQAPHQIDLEECWDRFYELLQLHQPPEFHKTRARRFSLYFSENLRFGYHLHASKIANAKSAEEMDQYYREYFAQHREEQNVIT
ncbi:MAG: tRNA-dihydrouridine synthase family protein [Spirochaetales bacterium]|nr:tRNA-dihydrouridine synthase family protein [Spirochaetales bacterium]